MYAKHISPLGGHFCWQGLSVELPRYLCNCVVQPNALNSNSSAGSKVAGCGVGHGYTNVLAWYAADGANWMQICLVRVQRSPRGGRLIKDSGSGRDA